MSGLDEQAMAIAEPAYWGGTALRPSDTQIAAGWSVDDRPPAKWLNWLHQTAGALQRAALGGALADISAPSAASLSPSSTSGTTCVMVHHPDLDLQAQSTHGPPLFCVSDPATRTVYISTDGGITWGSTGSSLASSGNRLGGTIDPSNVILFTGSGDGAIYFAADASFTYTTEIAFGSNHAVTSICTEYSEAAAYAVAGSSLGNIAVRVNGVGGAGGWSSVTTAPKDVGSWDSTEITSLCYLGSSEYLAMTKGGQVWRSTDRALTWSLLATLPGSGNTWHFVRCPHTGSLVAARDTASAYKIYYSRNNGTTWTEAVFPPNTTAPTSSLSWTAVKAVGGGAFLAASAQHDRLWRSVDSGRTWYPVWYEAGNNNVEARAIGCTRQRAVILWEGGSGDGIAHTGALDGRGV